MMTGIILAGGRSSRMGEEKALLSVGSERLIDVVIRRVRPYVERLMVIGHAGNLEQLRALPVDEVVTDCKPDCGPLMGVYTALMRSDTSWNLVVPCDMPWVGGRLFERLVAAGTDDVHAVASLQPADRIQPFPLVCHVRACRTVGALLDRGERSLHALVRHPQTRLVRIDEPELRRSFASINTVADYLELLDAHAVTS